METLLPCPFCGSGNIGMVKPARDFAQFWHECRDCGSRCYAGNWNTRPAEKLVPLDIDKAAEFLCFYEHGISLESFKGWALDKQQTALYQKAKAICNRFGTTEKLVPDEKKLINLLNELQSDGPENIDYCSYVSKQQLAEHIFDRFASVPVVLEVKWPEEINCPVHKGNACADCSTCVQFALLNAMRAACIRSFDKAVKEGRYE